MRVQQSRTHVLPLTWEIPTTIAASWLFLSLLMLPLGEAAATWLTGQGFTWPESGLMEATVAVLQGEPASEPALVYALIALFEVGVALIGLLALSLWWRSYGPGAQHGLATRSDIAVALGFTNLRRRKSVIRPDLYDGGRRRTPSAP
jgi:hypothetical protein